MHMHFEVLFGHGTEFECGQVTVTNLFLARHIDSGSPIVKLNYQVMISTGFGVLQDPVMSLSSTVLMDK